jgi:hypothetical protein
MPIGHNLDHGRVLQVLSGVERTLQRAHLGAGLDEGFDQVREEVGIDRNFVALQIQDKLTSA